MKNALLWLLWLSVMTVMLTSCSIDHGQTETGDITSPKGDGSAEWTVLYYGAGNYTQDLLPNGLSQTVATVHGLQDVFMPEQIHAVALTSTADNGGQCRFYDIRFHPGEAGNQISSTVNDWGRQDMSSPQLLKQFVDSTIVLHPARHYALIIGGEGEAWRGACRDDASGGRVMPIPAMYQSLDASVSQNGLPVHFDVLLWLTPGMNTMEVAYEMRGKVDYMVATASKLPQPGFLAVSQWLLDLAVDPSINAERLGRFMAARMYSRAQTAHDTLTTFNLLDLRSMNTLAQDVSTMADSIKEMMHGHSAQILQIWQSLWDAQTSDSVAMDLPAFVNAIRTDSIFYSVSGVRQTADRVRSSLDQVIIDRRSTRAGSLREGLSIYTPIVLSSEDLAVYSTLRMSNDEPGWTNFLLAMQASGTSFVQIGGSVRWTGHTLQNLYVFLNTAQVGAPLISLTAPVNLTTITTPDNAQFQASFALDGDSTESYIGVFQDLDNDQQLSSGDRYGYYHRNPSPQRDWVTVHSGDQLDSLQIDLNRTY